MHWKFIFKKETVPKKANKVTLLVSNSLFVNTELFKSLPFQTKRVQMLFFLMQVHLFRLRDNVSVFQTQSGNTGTLYCLENELYDIKHVW